MAITANTFTIAKLPTEGNVWEDSVYSADASGCEAVKAAETGRTHYVTELTVITGSNITISVGSGGDGGTGVTTIHFGPIPFGTTGGAFYWKAMPGYGLKCTSGLSIAVDASGAGATVIVAKGQTSL